MAKEYINGPMEENMKELGKMEKCMEKGNLLGKMVENILEII